MDDATTVQDPCEGITFHAPNDDSGNLSMNQLRLQMYLLYCAQQIDGGLRDKPGKYVTFAMRLLLL